MRAQASHVGVKKNYCYRECTMRAQASHVGVKKNYCYRTDTQTIKNFGVAIASRLAIAILRTKCY